MKSTTSRFKKHFKTTLLIATTALALLPGISQAWWNGDWASRKKITLNTKQIETREDLSQVPVLVRLHTGNFDFASAKDDGSDIRFVAEDDKTLLKSHVEKFDAVNEMGLIWVSVPKLTADKPTVIWMYSGNEKVAAANNAKDTFDVNQTAVFHFAEADGVPKDQTGNAINAAQFTAKLGDGSLMGRGATFDGNGVMTLASSPALQVTAARGFTVSAWIKTSAAQPNAIVFQQQDGAKSIVLGIESGKLYGAINGAKAAATSDLTPGSWHHVALSTGANLNVYLDGKRVATANTPLADMQGEVLAGKAFSGEMDELELASTARSADWIAVAAKGQGADALLLGYGEDESSSGGESASYFSTILHSVTLDGWVVIGILMVMLAISFMVMGLKAVVLRKMQEGNKAFLADYHRLALAETAQLDHEETKEETETHDSQLLSALSSKHEHYQHSSLYRVYHTGVQEVKNRLGGTRATQKLSPQALGSIKATMDATVVRETQKINSLMVLLTIAISGGPFLGLLGTVVGVMITFAAIAATGDVNVAAIAPGIAAALVATVAGLGVAIPALFGYNYLGSQIKDSTADMHVFADEFISRLTEAYSS
ncbi:MAG TPA: DUF2341 domain-containing protein [Gallionella sp.]|nr:DUF2341 domain-containing protein [Gallionella sp.]